MKIAKWGNSLAVRLLTKAYKALKLNEGDEVEIQVVDKQKLGDARDQRRERAMARVRALEKKLPPNWTFNRSEANAR